MIKCNKNNNKIKIIYSIVFNLIVLLLFGIFTNIYYDMADSLVFAEYIAEGYYQISFTNYFLCAFCGLIQNVIYPINAYVVIMIFVSFCSFALLTKIFLDKYGYLYATLIIVFIYSFFGVNHYSTISFTLATALPCAVGLLGLIHYHLMDKWKCGSIVSLIVVLCGSTYRFQAFEATFAVAGVFYILIKIKNYFKENAKFKIKNFLGFVFNKRFLLLFLILITVVFSCDVVSTKINNSTDELKYYTEYTNLRSQVWDYQIPSYEEAKEKYEEIGISENDLKMLDKMYMDDEGAFTVQKLEQIKALGDDFYANRSKLSVIASMIWVEGTDTFLAVTDKGMSLWSLFIVLAVYFLIIRKKYYFIPIILSLESAFLYIYLWLFGRCVYRAVYPIVLCAILCIIYSFDKSSLKSFNFIKNKNVLKSVLSIFTIILAIVITPLSYSCNLHSEVGPLENAKGYEEMLSYIKQNSNKKFMFSKGSSVIPVDNYKNPWLISVPEYLENTISFDGTYYREPYSNKKTKEFGTDNLFKYVIDNDNVYFVDNASVDYIRIFTKYLDEHYSKDSTIEYNLVKSIGDFNIYTIKSY